MHTTRLFRNGNSQAVRIPADLAYERQDIALEIEREGDEIKIRPARRRLSGVLSKFAQFSPTFMAEGRGDQEQVDWKGCEATLHDRYLFAYLSDQVSTRNHEISIRAVLCR